MHIEDGLLHHVRKLKSTAYNTRRNIEYSDPPVDISPERQERLGLEIQNMVDELKRACRLLGLPVVD